MRYLIILILLSSCVKEELCTPKIHTINSVVCADGIYRVHSLRTFDVNTLEDCKKYVQFLRKDYPEDAEYRYNEQIFNRDELIRCSCD